MASSHEKKTFVATTSFQLKLANQNFPIIKHNTWLEVTSAWQPERKVWKVFECKKNPSLSHVQIQFFFPLPWSNERMVIPTENSHFRNWILTHERPVAVLLGYHFILFFQAITKGDEKIGSFYQRLFIEILYWLIKDKNTTMTCLSRCLFWHPLKCLMLLSHRFFSRQKFILDFKLLHYSFWFWCLGPLPVSVFGWLRTPCLTSLTV